MSCNEWQKVKLGDLIESISVKHSFNKNKLIFLNTSDILEGKVLHNNYSDIEGLPGQAKKSIKKDDILFSEIRPKNKRFAYVDFDSDDYVVSTKLMVLRKKSNNINNRYLYYYLTSDKTLNYLQTIAEGRSGTFPQITFNELKIIEIDLPPIEEQEKIANILSSLDDKIELNNEMNKTLEEMAQCIFKRWFVDFEFPSEDGKPYKSSGGEMVDSELGMIPKGWEVKQLGEVIKITSGKRPKNKSKDKNEEYDTPIIGASSIMGYTNDFLYNERILVIGRVGTHGVVQRFKSKVWTSDNTFVIKSETYEYINQILKSIDYSSLNRGSTQPLITQTDIKNVLIVYPKYELLNKFENITSELLNRVEFNLENNIMLSNLRDSLLPKLMSGEIKV